MYIIIFVSASIVLYQYHLSNAWVLPQGGARDIDEDYVRHPGRTLSEKTNLGSGYNTASTAVPVSFCES